MESIHIVFPDKLKQIVVGIIGLDNESLGKSTAEKLGRALAQQVIRHKGVEILGPSKAALYQIQNKFRWHLILRGQSMQTLQGILAGSRELNELKSASSGKFKLSIDVDPFNLL